VEFFIYTVLLGFVGLNFVSFFTKKIYIFDFFFLALLIFDLLIVLPSYPTYVMNFKGINFTNYFLSLLILQILLSGGFEVAYMSFGSKIKRIEKTEITIDINLFLRNIWNKKFQEYGICLLLSVSDVFMARCFAGPSFGIVI